MGIIEAPLRFFGPKRRMTVSALFDSGADYSCIRPTLARCLGRSGPARPPYRPEGVRRGKRILAKEVIPLRFQMDGAVLSDGFLVVPGLSEDVIIGAATMQTWRLRLDFDTDRVLLTKKIRRFRLPWEGRRLRHPFRATRPPARMGRASAVCSVSGSTPGPQMT